MRLACCRPSDRRRLERRLNSLRRQGWISAAARAALQADLEAAIAKRQQRCMERPAVRYPGDLPISRHAQAIEQALREHQVLIVCGATGSGKSTQLPKICLAAGRGVDGMIGLTEPRRLAARAIAARLAQELGVPLGGKVGFKIRHTDRSNAETYIKVMTDGILLAELAGDRRLESYDTLIIDEVHERSLNIDFLLGYLKQLLLRRPDLKLIITSATLEVARFSEYFGGAPVIAVEGRGYPVEIRYRPIVADRNVRAFATEDAVLAAICECGVRDRGDILVFLEGEREIRELAEFLRRQHLPDTDILPLYARLSAAAQEAVFRPHRRRHVVLATNVAETSLTIPGICYVIDPGLARVSRYSARSKVQRLVVEKISRAAADQRAGRCGRTGPGVCLRLYGEDDFAARPAQTEPEIRRTQLASVILQMKYLRLGDIERFPFLDTPEPRRIREGLRLLQELGALDPEERLTPLGRQLAQLPVDPQYGRILIAGGEYGCLAEALIIVSALSIQDPREIPQDARPAADALHARFADERSDFVTWLRLWSYVEEKYRALSKSRFRELCQREFLSYARVREWFEVHRQLSVLARQLGLRSNPEPAAYANLHMALAAGLHGNIAQRTGDNEYTGARGIKPAIHPSSSQYRRRPKWFVAAEFVETSRLYARTVAQIEPEWLFKPAAHLLRREYLEPGWDEERQQVRALEKVTLHGLVLDAGRRVNFGPIDPESARRIFIEQALVGERLMPAPPFMEHNRHVIAGVRLLECKARRPDIVDEAALYEFYETRIPRGVHDAASLESWRRRAERGAPGLLCIRREDIMLHEAETITPASHPDVLAVNGLSLPLEYRFEPGSEDDGVTATVPLVALHQIDNRVCEWLIPGWRVEKAALLIKSLPRALRRHFLPIAETARRFVDAVPPGGAGFIETLTAFLQELAGISIPPDSWRPDELPPHLFLNFRVVGPDGRELARGRNLDALRARLSQRLAAEFGHGLDRAMSRSGITAWDFDTLPKSVTLLHQGVRVLAYPALVDEGRSVAIRLFPSAQEAEAQMEQGILRLFMLAQAKDIRYLRRHLPGIDQLCLLYVRLGDRATLEEDLARRAVRSAFLADGPIPRTRKEFDARLTAGRGRLLGIANEICELARAILGCYRELLARLDAAPALPAEASADIRQQLDHLIFPGFLQSTPDRWLREYPRYLEAIRLRLERLVRAPLKDRQKAAILRPWWQDYLKLASHANASAAPAELMEYRWLVEEFRVSLFAQELKTSMPVSVERLKALRARIEQGESNF